MERLKWWKLYEKFQEFSIKFCSLPSTFTFLIFELYFIAYLAQKLYMFSNKASEYLTDPSDPYQFFCHFFTQFSHSLVYASSLEFASLYYFIWLVVPSLLLISIRSRPQINKKNSCFPRNLPKLVISIAHNITLKRIPFQFSCTIKMQNEICFNFYENREFNDPNFPRWTQKPNSNYEQKPDHHAQNPSKNQNS